MWLTQIESDAPTVAIDTGIELLPRVHWGANICMFYESKADILNATVAYLRAGLINHEACLWEVSHPVTEHDALTALYAGIPDLDRHLKAGNISVSSGQQWNLKKDEFNLQRVTGGWTKKLAQALDAGYSGLRISGNAAWLESRNWREFCAYNQEMDRSIAGKRIIVLCTQARSTCSSQADDVGAARSHHYMIECHSGMFTFVDAETLARNNDDAAALTSAVDQLSASLKKHKIFLTHREKAVLALIVRGVSSKKGGQLLGISPRTIEFHRSNIMQKLNVHNVAELVHTVMRNTTIAV